MNSQPQAKKLSDYQVPDFFIPTLSLEFDLYEEYATVQATSSIQRNSDHNRPLVLDGVDLTLKSLEIDGQPFEQYEIQGEQLIIFCEKSEFQLKVVTEVYPDKNTSLEGLYKSHGAFCTQCEAEGFRKITYFSDRPDVLSQYRVRISADKTRYPFLLSNGNQTAQGELEKGRHFVEWKDPHNKPCYLFALVAGDFDLLTDRFTTRSGREVALELFVDKGNLHRGQHSLNSLKKAMAWDEQVYGLEYDLDIYMVVAVDFFNMGAMENKGLNIFNSKFVLADAKSATDDDYFNIESVIAHEYFHNWTGNRVTCRDWFQLSLKEGLTVFRDQSFSADMSSAVSNRIRNVKVIREHQFAEDAGPMAHPIRPESVIEMNNFYTVTVYDKGAEVIRMIHTLLGADGYRAGMDLYFERFDGQAVTCDDFVSAMEDASGVDLKQFRRWYSQSGTPELKVKQTYDAQNQRYSVDIQQVNVATADQQRKLPLHIPLDMALMDSTGQPLPVFEGQVANQVLDIKEEYTQLVFEQVKTQPVLSLLRGFSAPVKLSCDYTDDDFRSLILHAEDQFNRWDAAQQFYSRHLLDMVEQEENLRCVPEVVIDTVEILLCQPDIDPALLAELLQLPGFETLCQHQPEVKVDETLASLKLMKQTLANRLQSQWLALYQGCQKEGFYQYESSQVANRSLKSVCLKYLACCDETDEQLFNSQYQQADNMTDTLSVLIACQQSGKNSVFDPLMDDFEQQWHEDSLVLDKWFGLHASNGREDIIEKIEALQEHSLYSIDNPNRVRAVMGMFAFHNPQALHRIDGSGYQFLTDYLLKLDKVNPQVAARIVTPLIQWQRHNVTRQGLMLKQLERLADHENLSRDLFEKVSKSLEQRNR